MAVKRAAALLVTFLLVFAPVASAQPSLDELCADRAYAKLHPTICDNGLPFLLGGGQPGGGGGNGGLLGTIGKILGGLTGGIL